MCHLFFFFLGRESSTIFFLCIAARWRWWRKRDSSIKQMQHATMRCRKIECFRNFSLVFPPFIISTSLPLQNVFLFYLEPTRILPRHFIYNVFIFKLKIAPTTSLSIQRTRRFVIWFQVNSNCISSAILFEKSCQKEKQCRSRHVVVLFEGCCFSARADLFTRKKQNSLRFHYTEGAINRESA